MMNSRVCDENWCVINKIFRLYFSNIWSSFSLILLFLSIYLSLNSLSSSSNYVYNSSISPSIPNLLVFFMPLFLIKLIDFLNLRTFQPALEMKTFCCKQRIGAGKKIRERISGEEFWEKFESGFKVYFADRTFHHNFSSSLSLLLWNFLFFLFFSWRESLSEVPDNVSVSDEWWDKPTW